MSFLTSFAAFFSLGDIAGFFLVSRLFLCSLLMLLTPEKQWESVPTAPSIKVGHILLKQFATTEIDGE